MNKHSEVVLQPTPKCLGTAHMSTKHAPTHVLSTTSKQAALLAIHLDTTPTDVSDPLQQVRSLIHQALEHIVQTHAMPSVFEVIVSDAFANGFTRDLKPHIGCYENMFVAVITTRPGFVPAMFLKLIFTDTFVEKTCTEFNTDENPVFIELYDNVFERYNKESIQQQEIAVFIHGNITPEQLAQNILYPHFKEQQLNCPHTSLDLDRNPDINRGEGVKLTVHMMDAIP